MTFDNYTDVVGPKVAGTWNLHHSLSGHDLEFFIMLSSISGIIGNKGQAAYSASSTFMDAFSRFRNAQGLPAATVDLGAVSDIGYLAEDLDKKALVMESMASEGVNELEIHALIAAAVNGQMQSCQNHCITALDIGSARQPPFWVSDSKFADLRKSVGIEEGGPVQTTKLSIPQAMKLANSIKEAEDIVYDNLAGKISTVLMIPIEEIEGQKPISAYGLDSLVAVEIRNYITREMDASLQVLELLMSGTLRDLSRIILKKSSLVNNELFEEKIEQSEN